MSFVFPGAGQLYNRQRLLAAVFAIPVALGLIGAAVAIVTMGPALLTRLLDTRLLIALVVLDVVLLAWRVAAIYQAHRYRARFGFGRVGTYVTAGLLLVTLVMHAAPAWYAMMVLDTLSSVALEGDRADVTTGVRGSFPGFTAPSGEPLAPPSSQPQVDRGERVNILLVGVDSGAGRDHALTDTMLVVSLDADGESAMISLPRDLVNAPLPNGAPYPYKLNSLVQTANADPAGYPFGGGIATLKATIGGLLGATIHYFAAVDMAGFSEVIDAIGGVEVDVDRPINDPHSRLQLPAGRTFMDGELALLYVRSRYAPGDDDFVRADRQQRLLGAIREKLTRTNLLTTLPPLLDAVKNTVATDVPSGRISALAQLVQATEFSSIERVVLQPPDYVTPATAADGAYVLVPDLARIRALGQQLMGG